MTEEIEIKTYAQIVDGKVINVSVWNNEPASDLEGQFVEIHENSAAGIDWDYIDGEFVDNRPKTEIGAL
jgi:hypothetical protein